MSAPALIVPGRLTPDSSGRYLRDLLGIDFTEDQLRIATHRLCPQLVVAGAGSGKTMVMAARVVHAVAVLGVAPNRILGLTFTNKAAGELAARVRRSVARLGQAGLPPAPAEHGEAELSDELPTVSTYHSYAASVVRDHALRIGREPVTTLLTEAARWQLATRVVRSAPGPFDQLDFTTPTVAGRMLALAGEMAEHLVDSEQVRAADRQLVEQVDALSKLLAVSREARDTALARDQLLDLVDRYATEKLRLDLLDFGDQVALAARIAETSDLVGALERARFDLVVLDEYQDTGVAQRRMLTALFGGGHPVTAVGDVNQAIYGWRGASVGNLLRFPEHFRRGDGTVVEAQPLMTSFRCGGRILAAANAIAERIGQRADQVSAAPGERWWVDVPRLAPTKAAADAGEVLLARLPTDADEADWIAAEMAAELKGGTAAGEMAVLVRRSSDFPRLQRALTEHGVPVEVVGLGGLLQMPEVADVVAVLQLLDDPAANPAAIRVLTGPRWRIGPRDLAALGRRAGRLVRWQVETSSDGDADEPADESAAVGPRADAGAAADQLAAALAAATAMTDPVDVASLLDALESPGPADAYSAEALSRFTEFRDELRSLRQLTGQPLVELVTEVVRTIGLDVEIEAEPSALAAARSANLAAFVDQAARFSGLEGESDLAAFLAYLAAAEGAENGLDAGGVSAADTVKLLTVHKAKGLEWDVVAVPSLQHGVFPSAKGRARWTKAAHVLPGSLRGDADDLPRLRGADAVGLKDYEQQVKQEAADEERRLAYVAFTRARRRLLASAHCWSATRKTPAALSAYLNELLDLGEPTVRVGPWCDDPADDDQHPLQAAAADDIPWPVPADEEVIARRRAAADAVRRAMTSDRPPGPADSGWGLQVELVLDELRRQRDGVREVPLPRQLTASQVVMLAHDPAELARSIARPLPTRPVAQARRGSRFHAWVEQRWQASPLLDPEDLPGAIDADLADEELTALQQQFLADGWGEVRPVAVEQPFEYVVAGRVLRGRIDAVYGIGAAGEISPTGATDGGYDVIDYKTGKHPSDMASASLQLSIYRLAWAELAGVDPGRVRAAFLYVRSGELLRPAPLLSAEQLAELLAGQR